MRISLSADSPSLLYVSTHSSLSRKPSVVLHGGAIPSFAALATADFHSFSSTVDILLGQEAHSLIKSGTFSSSQFFHVLVPSTGLNERFEWKPSSGAEVALLQGRRRGMKLVRVATGEVVAAWARPNSGRKKKGKLRFLVCFFGGVPITITKYAYMRKCS